MYDSRFLNPSSNMVAEPNDEKTKYKTWLVLTFTGPPIG